MRSVTRLIAAGAIALAAPVLRPAIAAAAPTFTIEMISWSVVGLDSNDVSVGPNVFPIGARVCNNGTTDATGVTVQFVWDSANPYVALDEGDTVTIPSLAVGACTDVYWNVVVQRDAAAYGTARSYHVSVTDSTGAAASTVTPREIYVEAILSQNRNQVISITGPSNLTIGDEATFVVTASTAPNGYEQLESYLTLPSSLFELLSVSTTYGGPPQATTDLLYADACGWDDDPSSPTYRTCIGPENMPGGKAGGQLDIVVRVRALAAGTANLTAVIYDLSGASYHYNSDFGVAPNLLLVTISAPAPQAPQTTATTAPPQTTATTLPPIRTTTTSLPRTGGSMPLAAAGALLVLAGRIALAARRVAATGRPTSQ